MGCFRKAVHPVEDIAGPPYEFVTQGDQSVLVIRDFELGRAFMRINGGTMQAGFLANQVAASGVIKAPLLFQEGATHRAQRRSVARFFTPKAVTTRHTPIMEDKAEDLVSQMERDGGGTIDKVAFRMTLGVVAQVLGLTDSQFDGMEKRLDRFFAEASAPTTRMGRLKQSLRMHSSLWMFYVYDVRPAIVARRDDRREDVISSLLDQGYSDIDVLPEAIAYGAAGMVTTREFITMAVWHLLQNPPMAEAYRNADRDGRFRMFYELVRLEPVGGHLMRSVIEDLVVEADGHRLEIPVGTLVDVRVRDANADTKVFGDDSKTFNANRCPAGKMSSAGLAFGAGHHSCPGEYLAMEETDVFLQRFLRSDWELVSPPVLSWNDIVRAYHLTGAQVRLKP